MHKHQLWETEDKTTGSDGTKRIQLAALPIAIVEITSNKTAKISTDILTYEGAYDCIEKGKFFNCRFANPYTHSTKVWEEKNEIHSSVSNAGRFAYFIERVQNFPQLLELPTN
ncbi:hypothetical protein TNCV_4684331 [Trichonephila clavipes]|nr:hypothetical protein TNCV_4684331 [Trichonephila clavipes]